VGVGCATGKWVPIVFIYPLALPLPEKIFEILISWYNIFMSQIVPHQNAYNFFIRWFTTPPNERIPASKDQFYTTIGINDDIVAEYQSRDTYYDDIYKEARNWGRSKIPQLLHMLYEEFKQTKKPAILETYKKLLEVDKKEGGSTFNFNTFNPSDEQYRQILAREAKSLEAGSEESPLELLSTPK